MLPVCENATWWFPRTSRTKFSEVRILSHHHVGYTEVYWVITACRIRVEKELKDEGITLVLRKSGDYIFGLFLKARQKPVPVTPSLNRWRQTDVLILQKGERNISKVGRCLSYPAMMSSSLVSRSNTFLEPDELTFARDITCTILFWVYKSFSPMFLFMS